MVKSIAAVAALFATVSVQAATVTVYTDEASYLAAVGATRTYIDFAGAGGVVNGQTFSPDVAFGSCTDNAVAATCGTSVLHSSNGITDLGGSAAPNGVASVAWRLNLPDVFAFGFNYVSGKINSINIVGAGLGLTNLDTSAASGFIGLVSDAAFYGAIAVNGVFPGGGNDRYFIDDFRINEAARVPEPGSLVLVGLGLFAAHLLRRRRGSAR